MAPFAVFLLTLFILHHGISSELPEKEKIALVTFIDNVNHSARYNWNKSEPPCSWRGVFCDDTNSTVIYLKFPAASLIGEIPSNTIGVLSSLRVLSLHTNALTGTIPSDFSNLVSLTHLFLYKNAFSGQLPDLNAKFLRKLDVSNNKLNSSIPSSLSKFPKSAFSGNIYLCGEPFPHCKTNPSPSSSEPQAAEKKPNKKRVIVGISVGSALLLLILLFCLRKKIIPQSKQPPKLPLETSAAASRAGTSTEGERNKLVLLDDGICSFDLDDLLRASAEVLGKGSVGTSYRRVLKEKKTTVVVKRLKDVVVTKKEFESTMEVLGNMKNENVVPLRAFYYSKDEKWLVYDYMHAGSLSAFLHGRIGSSRTRLDWDHRLRIALSAARGLAYLHAGKVVHGNIKSSNIFLRQETNAASVSDYGLNTLFGGLSSPNHVRVTGYQAPEIVKTRKVTSESDVYSFGVLLLELLTRKAPNQASKEGNDFPLWVQSVVSEEPKAEIFDVESRDRNIKEMVQLLRIAKDCASIKPEQRPAMQNVVSMLEDMNRVETDYWFRHSSDDRSKGYDDTPSTETRDTPSTVTP